MSAVNSTNISVTFIPTIDPYTVLLLATATLVFTAIGLTRRGAIFALIGGVFGFITGMIYAGGFTVYDPATNTLIVYKSIPLAFLFITIGIADTGIAIYKILTYPTTTRW